MIFEPDKTIKDLASANKDLKIQDEAAKEIWWIAADGQEIFVDQLPNGVLAYGLITITNMVNITNGANINCTVDATPDLRCTASGAAVTIGALTGSFDVNVTVTPSTKVNATG